MTALNSCFIVNQKLQYIYFIADNYCNYIARDLFFFSVQINYLAKFERNVLSVVL